MTADELRIMGDLIEGAVRRGLKPTASPLLIKQSGAISTFGGPSDTGVSASEGLALIEPVDLKEWWFARLFLGLQPDGTSGLARRLDPNSYYIAMRFDYAHISREIARRSIFRLTNPTGKSLFAQAADWGPNARTKRLVDMSPGAAKSLGLKTDEIVDVEMFLA